MRIEEKMRRKEAGGKIRELNKNGSKKKCEGIEKKEEVGKRQKR